MLSRITPETGLHYVFHGPNDLRLNCPQTLGSTEALNELHQRGCIGATKPWLDNHWSLILWKLAGMVALDPQTEGIPEKKRWCWSEVIHQLLYR
jgi:breast cancer 2 susceptibility protein